MNRWSLTFLVYLLLLMGCENFFSKQPKRWLVTECLIYDFDGKIVRQYDGSQCVFLKDGSWVARDRKTRELFLRDAQYKEKWRIRRHFHHTLMQLADGDLLGLSSSVRKYKGKMTRFDVVVKINLEGKIIATYDFFEKIDELKAKLRPPITDGFSMIWENDFYSGLHFEFSHANSAYEIPDNETAKNNPAFKKGNIIVHAGGLDNFFILDKNLKAILWAGRFYPGIGRTVAFNHDAQVLRNGNILLYVNQIKDREDVFSALVEIDPRTLKTLWHYEEKPRMKFSSEVCGGVDVLHDGRLVYTDTTKDNKIKIINRDGSESKSFSVLDLGYKVLNVREAQLQPFFEKNSGL